MSKYNCFICNSLIEENIYKAYDQNLCSNSCRECLFNKFNFNNYYKLEEKKPIKKSNSNINIFSSLNYESNIEFYKNNNYYINEEIKSKSIYLSSLFNKKLNTPNTKFNESLNSNKSKKRYCINMYPITLQNIRLSNIIFSFLEKTKKILVD